MLPTGTIPPNPSELLLNPRFRDVLLEMTANYDAIIIDVPPVLAVTDAVIVGREAANNFLVLRFGQHTMREIREAIKRLEHGGIKVQGVIMNAVTERASAYGNRKYG